MAAPLPQAQCEFYKYLETLDGYPTVTPARTPAPGPLDPATLTLQNVVVIDKAAGPLGADDVAIGFDAATSYLTISPKKGWAVNNFYVVGVRGYGHGVKTATGRDIVAPVPYFLLKQESSLTCGATTPETIPDTCPAYALLASQMAPPAARATTAQLEALRTSYIQLGVMDVLARAGLPKSELAMFWAFPTHSSPVAEVNPPTGAVPRATDDKTLVVAVKGALDPATLIPTRAGRPASVTFLDLTELGNANLIGGLPAFEVKYEAPSLIVQARDPLVRGHQYGIFLDKSITSPDGKPLVPSPVSFLLTARGSLVSGGKSQVGGVSDADAAMLEAGRLALRELFDNPLTQAITGLDRAKLAYVFAFPFGGP
jgi:hypothetical protein